MRLPKYVLGIVAIAFVAGFGAYATSLRTPMYQFAEVRRGDIVQEVLASGNVAAPDSIDLQFQNAGKLSAISVETGESVAAGEVLARLDTSVLEAQRAKAAAELATEKAQLQSLQEGTRPEEIAVTRAQVESDKIALSQAGQSVVDAIKNAYSVSDSVVKNTADTLFDNPQTNPTLTFIVNSSTLKSTVESQRAQIGLMLATWLQSVATLIVQSNISAAEENAHENLSTVSQFLTDANSAVSSAISSPQVTPTVIATWQSNLASARTMVNTAITALTTASTARKNAAATLERDQKTLALQEAGSTASSVAAQVARVQAAQANLGALDAQIAQMRLIAPVSGVVTKVNGEIGETVNPAQIVVSMIPDAKLQIDLNLSEDNVAQVRRGDPARIRLDAFGQNAHWNGTVQKVDPAETVLGGAIYYKTTVLFTTPDDRVKPGMTADVWIQTGTASSTLRVPASAITYKNGASIVRVQEGNSTVERQVETGLKGVDGYIEILSGLSQGDQVVIGE